MIKTAHKYLVEKHKSPSDVRAFRQQLYDLWFKLYRRTRGCRDLDSSAFEHVFVGETRGGKEVLGFHNWVQFYLQEKAGNVDYQGYILGTKVRKTAALLVVIVLWLNLYDLLRSDCFPFLVPPCSRFNCFFASFHSYYLHPWARSKWHGVEEWNHALSYVLTVTTHCFIIIIIILFAV